MSESKISPQEAGAALTQGVQAASHFKEKEKYARNGASELPQDESIERGLLSTLFVDPELIAQCRQANLRPENFYYHNLGQAYEVMTRMADAKVPIDPASFAAELTRAKLLHELGGHRFVMEVSEFAATTANFPYFLRETIGLATRRELIRHAQRQVEEARDRTIDLAEVQEGAKRRLEAASKPLAPPTKDEAPSAFAILPPDHPSFLLGHGFLSRGDGCITAAPSGVGKSSLSLQQAVLWALGKPSHGIAPHGPLKSLYLQAEDGPGDLGEIFASIAFKLQLTPDQRAQVDTNLRVVTERVRRGHEFLAELKRLTSLRAYDLVWLNPLASFMSGDNTSAEQAGNFLRAGLTPLTDSTRFAYMLVHHTTKPPTGKDRSERSWAEEMYGMAGSYELIGWARAIMILKPAPTEKEFTLLLAKRGQRANVTRQIPQGAGYRLENTTQIPLKWSSERMPVPGSTPPREINVIFWEDREPEEDGAPSQRSSDLKRGAKSKYTLTDFMGIFPVDKENAMGLNALHRAAQVIKPGIGKSAFYALLEEAIDKRILIHSGGKSPGYFIKSSGGL